MDANGTDQQGFQVRIAYFEVIGPLISADIADDDILRNAENLIAKSRKIVFDGVLQFW